MGLSMLLFLIVMRLVSKKVKKLHWIGALGPILACIISIIAVVAGQLENKGIKVVKNIPHGMASPSSGLLLPTVILAQHTVCRCMLKTSLLLSPAHHVLSCAGG